MRITKFGHACVCIEHEGQVVVLDPGGWTEPEAVEGATAVLITHEHADHLDHDRLRATDAPIYAVEAVRAALEPDVAERVTVVHPGDLLDVGVPATVVGEQHAVIHPDIPRIANSGFVLDLGGTRVYHPGDSLTPPGQPVDLLLLPVHAPWSKISEVIDFARAVGAPRALAVHDGLLSDNGIATVAKMLGGLYDGDYERVAPGSDVSV